MKKNQYVPRPEAAINVAPVGEKRMAQQIQTTQSQMCEALTLAYNKGITALNAAMAKAPKTVSLDNVSASKVDNVQIAIDRFPDIAHKTFQKEMDKFKQFKLWMIASIIIFNLGVFMFAIGLNMICTEHSKTEAMQKSIDREQGYADFGRYVFYNTGGFSGKWYRQYRTVKERRVETWEETMRDWIHKTHHISE